MGDIQERGKAVCIQLEGTLEDGASNPRAGAVDFVRALRERGYEVIILTTGEPEQAREWLVKEGFAETHAQRELAPARALLSARALAFEGRFEGLIERIEAADSRRAEP